MANVLSQSEIDELLSALDAGESISMEDHSEDENAGVRVYDFRTANKFYKEQMRTLNVVFDNFAYAMANKMTGMLHTVCEVEVISVEEQSFGEFNNSLPDPVVLGVVEMAPLSGSLLVEMCSSLVYGYVARLFGGTADYTMSGKSFTEIEMSIVESVLYQTMDIMRESWEKIADVNPVLKRIETSSQFTQITALNEPSAIVTFNVQLDDIQGMMSICIPHIAIQPIAKLLTTVNWSLSTTDMRQESKEDILKDQVDNTYVTMQAHFNNTVTTLREILNMKKGDIICIDHSIREYITVNVEQLPKFKGVVGSENKKYAVQIAEIIKESEDFE